MAASWIEHPKSTLRSSTAGHMLCLMKHRMARCIDIVTRTSVDYCHFLERIETRWCLGDVATLHLCSTLVLWQGDYDKRLFYPPRTGTLCENISCVACCS